MRWPKLVPLSVCNTPVIIHLTDGNTEDGEHNVVKTVDGMCSYSEKSRQILDAERRLITLEATALLGGDIAPELVQLEGSVTVMGQRREIYRAARARNPDGTVNYTQLELM